MTEEKFAKLSEEDLEMVSGGDEFQDVFIFKKKDGNYLCIHTTYTGTKENFQGLLTLLSGGSVSELNIPGLGISRMTIPASAHDRMVAKWQKRGYTIHEDKA